MSGGNALIAPTKKTAEIALHALELDPTAWQTFGYNDMFGAPSFDKIVVIPPFHEALNDRDQYFMITRLPLLRGHGGKIVLLGDR